MAPDGRGLGRKRHPSQAGLIKPLHSIGILPPPAAPDLTYRELSVALANRLYLI